MKLPPLDIITATYGNGFRVLVVEDHHIPIVTSTMWYAVGSAHESDGITGISHFLEHLLFKGTPSYPKGTIDLLTAAYGGHNNAGTIYDYTMYYFNFSSDRWNIALDIEADRMQHCLFEPEEIEPERQVVLEELAQTEDSPWGPLGIQVETTMFAGHPYAHTPIGTREDLECMSRDDLLSYYRTYYVPNNATLVVVGDICATDVINKGEEAFASIPRGNPVQSPAFFPISQQEEQRFEIVQDINLKRFHIGYHVPGMGHPDRYALDIIEHLLSHGKTSRFYQRLVDQEQMVTFVDAYYHSRKAAGVFHLFAELRPGCSPEQVEMMLDEEIARLRMTPVSEDELTKVKQVIAANSVFERETTIGLAHIVGEYAVSHTHEEVNAYASRIDAVTSEEIVRVANDYLLPERRTVGWAFPEHPEKERQTIIVPDEPLAPVPTEMVF